MSPEKRLHRERVNSLREARAANDRAWRDGMIDADTHRARRRDVQSALRELGAMKPRKE